MRFTLALAALMIVTPASAKRTWDQCLRKYCTSGSQPECMITAGAAICDKDEAQCITLPGFTAAKILVKSGKRYQIQTAYGRGWVSEQMFTLDVTEDCSR